MSKPAREAISHALNFVHGQNVHPLFKFVEEDMVYIPLFHPHNGICIQDGVMNVNLSSLAMINFDNIIKE